jgi:hypothetical protein
MHTKSTPRSRRSLLFQALLLLCCSLACVASSRAVGGDVHDVETTSTQQKLLQQQQRRRLQTSTAAPTGSVLASDPTGTLSNGTIPIVEKDSTEAVTALAPMTLLDLPPSVDIVECRKHLQVADVDRNNLLREEEYVKFVHEIVSHDYNHTLANVPETTGSLVWGNKLSDLPAGIQANYHNLSIGGAIEIVGYKPLSPDKTITLSQELFLIKVCVHTQVAVHQVLKQMEDEGQTNAGFEGGASLDTTQQASSIPEINVVIVYSSFSLSNKVGIHSANLNADVDGIRKALVTAYQALVTQVVSEQTGMSLSNPALSAANTDSRSSTGTVEGREATRRRRLTVAVDPQLPDIYTFQDVACPGVPANVTSSLLTEWCQVAYGKFVLYLVARDSIQVYEEYSRAMQNASDLGRLQDILQKLSPMAEVQVTGAGPTLLPLPPTPAPTPVFHQSPTASPAPHLMVIPKESTTPGKKDLGLIFALAGTLMAINICIIGSSIYACVRNRKNPKIPDFDDDDHPMEGINDAYYNNLRKSKKKRSSGRRVRYDDQSESRSNPPTLEDIAEANSLAPVPTQDAAERERILRGQGSSYHTATSITSEQAPTREEIRATLQPTGSGRESSSVPSQYEENEELPANTGEMA